jgi:SOS-response transcriptional repressor LexA
MILTGETTELVFGFIDEFIQQKGHAPSQREIARGCYLAQSSVRYHLAKLQAEGRINYDRGKARALSVSQ